MSTRYRAFTLLLAACSVALIAIGLQSSRKANGRLHFDVSSYDFGRAPAGSSVTHVFRLRNDTDAEVRFESIKPSCGCTVTARPPAIPAHSSIDFPVTVKLPMESHKVETSVAVTTQDHTILRLHIRGTATLKHPERVDFGRVLGGRPTVKSFEICSLTNRTLHIKRLICDEQRVRAVAVPANDPRDAGVQVTIFGPTNLDGFVSRLVIETDDEEEPRYVVEVCAKPFRLLEPEREVHSFGSIPRGQNRELQIRLRVPYSAPVRVTGASAALPHSLVVAVDKVFEDHGFVVVPVTYLGGIDPGNVFQTKIVLECTDGTRSESVECLVVGRQI